MVRASVAFVAPTTLTRTVPGVATFTVAPASVPAPVLEQELRARLGHAGADGAPTSAIAPRLVATLAADRPCVIELQGAPADRAVALGERTTWEWLVRPTPETGTTLELTVTLSAPVVVDGHETSHSVGVYRARLSVQPTYRDILDSTLAWMGFSVRR